MDPHVKSDSSILSVLHSDLDALGRRPAKKPRYSDIKQTPEEKKESEERLERERVAESARKKEVEAEAARIAADEAEHARFSGVFQAMKQNAFKHVHEFMTGLFTSTNQATASQAGWLLSDHGGEIFDVMAAKNPDVATKWAHKWMIRVYATEAKNLWKLFRPGPGGKLELIESFSLATLMTKMEATAPYLLELLASISFPNLNSSEKGPEKNPRRRDTRLVRSLNLSQASIRWSGTHE